MNDMPDELLRMLERATAPAGRVGDLPVDETISGDGTGEEAELRAAWLELGRRLEASERTDESARQVPVVDVDGAAESANGPLRVAERARPAARRLRPWLALVEAAAAAALLLAVVHWSRPGDSNSPLVGAAGQHGSGGPQAAPLVAGIDASPGGASYEVPPGESLVDEAAWDDSFDEQLADAQQRLAQLFAGGASSETRVQSLRDAMEQFDADLNANSL